MQFDSKGLFTRAAVPAAAALMVLAGAARASAQSGMAEPTPPQAQMQSSVHKHEPRAEPFTFEASYKTEHINVASDKHDVKLQLTRTMSKRTSLTAGYEQQSNFDELDGQVNIGITHALNKRMSVTGNFTQGIAADLLAGQVYDVQATIKATPHFIPQLEYSFSDFTTSHHGVETQEHLHLLGIGAELPIPSMRSALTLTYQYSNTNHDDDDDHSGSFEYAYMASKKLSIILGGGYGSERVLAHTHTEIFRNSDTLSAGGGIKYRLSGGRGIKLGYQFQDRKQAYKVNVVSLGFYSAF